jgi:hypothetical protein
MKKTLEKLREKDNHEKQRIAFVSSLVITGLIVMFWLAAITTRPVDESQRANVITPFEALRNDLSEIFNN